MTRGRKSNVQTTSAFLRELLTTRSEYCALWVRWTQRRETTALSHAAVAQVIALHLWDMGERDDSSTNLARAIKDRVRRALAGETLTAETLGWFIHAFDMYESDANYLWVTFTGRPDDSQAGISLTTMVERPMRWPQRHRTLALFERYHIDGAGTLVARTINHVIMALEDGVGNYPFIYKGDALAVEILHGGALGELHDEGDGTYSHNILLTRTLSAGSTTSLDYRVVYPSGGSLCSEVRRAVRGRSANIDIAVQFERDRVPRATYWTVWSDATAGPPIEEATMGLDEWHRLHRFVRFAEHTALGFRWIW